MFMTLTHQSKSFNRPNSAYKGEADTLGPLKVIYNFSK